MNGAKKQQTIFQPFLKQLNTPGCGIPRLHRKLSLYNGSFIGYEVLEERVAQSCHAAAQWSYTTSCF